MLRFRRATKSDAGSNDDADEERETIEGAKITRKCALGNGGRLSVVFVCEVCAWVVARVLLYQERCLLGC
jgi:hypothetical protein